MNLYCMCGEPFQSLSDDIDNIKFRSKNLYVILERSSQIKNVTGVVLDQEMDVIKMGIDQFVFKSDRKKKEVQEKVYSSPVLGSNDIDDLIDHLRRVDLRQCQNCGSVIAVEG